jgi:uncharacterized protein
MALERAVTDDRLPVIGVRKRMDVLRMTRDWPLRIGSLLALSALLLATAASYGGDYAQPVVQANAGAPARILIVTGMDYPGHKWKETSPALVQALAADKRLEVSVVEDARFLASTNLPGYKAIVLHYMNWQDPGPGMEAQQGLLQAVTNGTGLVLVHFACGAFQTWPEFVGIAGRVWNPKLRGHDPYGQFTVSITDPSHAITAGVAPFTTQDELYTCLAGHEPIRGLASATSKVDHKVYPMAFVLACGKGRVFHCVLGHDAQAFSGGAGTLYRRGAAWTAGLNPSE